MYTSSSARRVTWFAAALLLAACSDSPTPAPPPVLTAIAVSPGTAELHAVGDSVRLTATARDQNGNPMDGHPFQWTSTDTTLATVDANGLVRARASGSVTITAVTSDKSGTADITLALRQTMTVPPAGGELAVGGAGRVMVPSGAFASPQPVTVEVTRAAEVEVDYSVTGEHYHAGPRVANEVRVRIGTTLPLASLTVELEVPAAFTAALPSTHRPELFVEFLQSDGEEILDDFVPVAATYDASTRRLQASLPPEAFTHWRRLDETLEAIMVIGSVPAALQLAEVRDARPVVQKARGPATVSQAAPSPCPHDALVAPLDGSMHVTGAYTGTGHKGVDLRAASGTPVYASRQGVVEKVGFDERPLPKPDPRSGKKVKGWGRYVRVRHADGSSTLYAHLTKESTDNLKTGGPVAAGEQVALSGNTGGSSAPHLHLEYVRPNGTQFDPTSCIAASIEIDPASATLGAGQTVTLNARVVAVGGSDLTARAAIAWSSSDADMATVENASGLVRANSQGRTGTAQIRATFGRVEATAPITVHALPGSWAGTWTHTSGEISGGMTLTVEIQNQTARGTLAYDLSGSVYFRRDYEGTATATTLRIVLPLDSGGNEEVALAISGSQLVGTIVDHHPDGPQHFTAVLNRVAQNGAALVGPPVTSSRSGPVPMGGPPR